MFSKDFKKLSLEQLKGNWGKLLLAMFIAIIAIFAAEMISQAPIYITMLFSGTVAAIPVSLIMGVITIILIFGFILVTGCIEYGISKYILEFVRKGTSDLKYIFCGFSYGGKTINRSFILCLLINIFTFLWSLLFIIPGIIASLRYMQAFFILADDDSISPSDAIKISKQMMKGYKGRAFCLMLSFIGWVLLCMVPSILFAILSGFMGSFGFIFTAIGSILTFAAVIVLMPYLQTAYANFYEYLRGIYEKENNILK